MKCDICENEATVFLTQIINGQMTTVNLCDVCSKAKGVTDETGFGLAEAFLSAAPGSAESELVCPACGFTSAQLKKIGRMGCPECYTTFRHSIEGLLKSMHKGTRHVGKAPQHLVARAVASAGIAQLRQELEQAVREERYEDAARLKGEIQNAEAAVAKTAAAPAADESPSI